VNRHAANTVIRELQRNGFEAFLVGGCVRDMILGDEPKDFDVTTNALPEQVQAIFAKTLPVGVSFGVVIVVVDVDGKNEQIEVATYRKDGVYSDGRRPDTVEYGKTAREDVERRDFTMNGLLLTTPMDFPVKGVTAEDHSMFDGYGIADFVGGMEDIENRVIRCIGDPNKRFTEDALRMLRAVRFAAKLGFDIEPQTMRAIAVNAPKMVNISRERVAMELFKLLTAPFPIKGIAPLFASGLAAQIFPREFMDSILLGRTLRRFEEFHTKDPILAMAMFLADAKANLPMVVCQALKLSNDEKEKIVTGLLYVPSIQKKYNYNFTPASVKRMMRQPGIEIALDIAVQDECIGVTNIGHEALMSIVMDFRKLEQDEIYPKPLVTGDDLIAAGYKPSKAFRDILYAVETEQLDGILTTREQALQRARLIADSTAAVEMFEGGA
jgi:tRNA nucleotidyltransferase/poly(A) polymerase